jgi:hypothetical protein
MRTRRRHPWGQRSTTTLATPDEKDDAMHHALKLGTVCSLFFLSLLTACGHDGDDGDDITTPDASPVVVGDGGIHDSGPYPPPYDEVVLIVRNATSRVIYKLYSSPSSDDYWGPDLLKSSVLAPGASATFTSEYCDDYYDLKAVDVAGNTIGRAFNLYFACGRREQVTVR